MMFTMPNAAWRRYLVGAICLLTLAGCGPAATGDASSTAAPTRTSEAPPATPSATGGYARRAAAQLEVEALPGADGGRFAGRELDLPLATPDFVLTDTDGKPFDFQQHATRPVTLLYFGYASCPDVCPAHMAAISKALSELPDGQAEQVQVLFVSVDSVNDTPDTLGSYLGNFDDDFVGLTGTADEINHALSSVGLPPTAISSADEFPPRHPSDVLAYTSDGRAHVVYPFGTAPSAYSGDIPQLISTDWRA
jgi:protein SCO1